MLSHIVLSISAIAASIILLLSLVSAASKRFQFWPPPAKESWQHRTFMSLFRAFLYPLILLTALEFELLDGNRAILQYSVGTFMLLTGFGLAFWITIRMGWRKARIEDIRLVRMEQESDICCDLGWACRMGACRKLAACFDPLAPVGAPLSWRTIPRRALVRGTVRRPVSRVQSQCTEVRLMFLIESGS